VKVAQQRARAASEGTNPCQRLEESDMTAVTQDIQTTSESSVSRLARSYFEYVTQLIQSIDLSALEQVVNRLHSVREHGACVYIMGNGGSAATASHFANDLGKAAKKSGRPPIRAFCLTDNVPWLTALANDDGYEHVFAGQLDNHLRTGDVVIAISASGNSPNLMRALELAKLRGATTIGILGFDGGTLRRLVDITLLVPSRPGYYGPVEDVHLILEHAITACLAQS